ncbi:MAG: efflux RND transporter periplasmic adaptor subunit [Selenomonadaceae bacterium]|nr:efflux RND transporter periplasmic adaptor subunit [Selenomonadaceae bacterium]
MFFIGTKRSRLKAVALGLSIAATVSFFGCGKQQQARGPQQVLVKSMSVIRRDTPDIYEFTGFIEAEKEAVLQAQVSGKITGKHFIGGEQVEEGQLLYTIDNRLYEGAYLSAKANYARAQADQLRLSQDLERYEKLYAQAAISHQQYDLAVSQAAQAEAAAAAAGAALRNAEVDLGETEVRAPFAGRVSTSDLSVGNFVAAGQTVLLKMSDVNPVKVKFSISEKEYLSLMRAKGSSELVDLSLVLTDNSIYKAKGKVTEVDRGIGDGTLTIKAQFPNNDRLLLPGMFARVQANAGIKKNAILIPQRAIKDILYKKFVAVIDSENKIQLKEVQVGKLVGRLIMVESGLEGNENIVVEGIQNVNNGVTVTPQPMTEAELDKAVAR